MDGSALCTLDALHALHAHVPHFSRSAFAFALCVTYVFCTSTRFILITKISLVPRTVPCFRQTNPFWQRVSRSHCGSVCARQRAMFTITSRFTNDRACSGMWGSVKRTHSAFDGRVINVEAPKAKAAGFEPRPARHAGVFSRAGRSIFTVPYILAHRRVDTPSHRLGSHVLKHAALRICRH